MLTNIISQPVQTAGQVDFSSDLREMSPTPITPLLILDHQQTWTMMTTSLLNHLRCLQYIDEQRQVHVNPAHHQIQGSVHQIVHATGAQQS
jgi:hypothetical protein